MRAFSFAVLSSLVLSGCYESRVGDVPDGGFFDAPSGDRTCDAPDDLGSRMGTVASGTTTGRRSSHEASCGAPNRAPDAVFTWTAPDDGVYSFDTNGSDFDTVLEVLAGSCDGAVVLCNDDGGEGTRSRIIILLTAGQRVAIVVDGYSSSAGRYQLQIAREGARLEDCFNGRDDDEDGLVDCDDPMCFERCGPRRENCFNGRDDDMNGLVDCEDPACRRECGPRMEDCFNGVDDDGDGRVDCEDPDCFDGCGPTPVEDCFNGRDDDGDGQVDCDDPDCRFECDREEDCFNGRDDDGDRLVDCEDFDCDEFCEGREICDNGRDDDRDGLVDCEDPSCARDEACGPPPPRTCPDESLGTATGLVVTGRRMPMRPSERSGSCAGSGPEIEYTWTAPAEGVWQVSTTAEGIDRSFDTVLYVLDGICEGPEVACDDDSGERALSRLRFVAEEGATYTIVVDTFATMGGEPFTLRIER